MVQNTDIARRLGYLKIADKDIIDAYDLKGCPPDSYVVMCTGSQGEPLSALARIASDNHKTISVDEGDTVIISATPVPGNEKAVTKVTNDLAKIGADVYDKSRARVHVSGHASAEELKLVLSIVQPKHFMPVHGEATHLRAHAALAEATGVQKKNIFICENGESLELTPKGVRRGKPWRYLRVCFERKNESWFTRRCSYCLRRQSGITRFAQWRSGGNAWYSWR